MASTSVSRLVRAPAAAVYAALLDAGDIARWRVPDGMTSTVHHFEPWEGGVFRVSLTYEAGDAAGKSSDRTDTYAGHFTRLVPDALVVEVLAFESDDEAMRREMTMTTTLRPSAGGTEVTIEHAGLPAAVSAADNEAGTRMALDHLASLVEGRMGDDGRGGAFR